MTDRRIRLPRPDTVTLSTQTADKLIGAGDGNAALLYLYVLRVGGALSVSEAASALRRGEGDIAAATELLGRLGLLQVDGPAETGTPSVPGGSPMPPDREELPEYSAEDIRRELDNGSVFSSLVREVQKSLGKLLSSEDLIKLFGIYDCLGLPPDVILHLVTYCIDENRRRYGPGKVPTIRYIEKAAYTWEREGIFTLGDAERYLKQRESTRSLISEVRRVLQIPDRELTTAERKYVEEWLSMGFTPETIEIAYDITVFRTQKFSWSYMHTIIGDWFKKGLRTPEDIRTKDVRNNVTPRGVKKKDVPAAGEDLADIERMKKYLEKLRER